MEQISRSKQKARKQHKCDWCELPIEIGTEYERSLNKHDGELYTWKNHISCAKIANKLKMFDSVWDEGLTGDNFQECIKDEYSQIMSDHYTDIYESPDFKIPSFSERLEFVKNYHFNVKVSTK